MVADIFVLRKLRDAGRRPVLRQAPVLQLGENLTRRLGAGRSLIDHLLKSIRDGLRQRVAGIDAETLLDEVLGARKQLLTLEKSVLELFHLAAELSQQPPPHHLALLLTTLSP